MDKSRMAGSISVALAVVLLAGMLQGVGAAGGTGAARVQANAQPKNSPPRIHASSGGGTANPKQAKLKELLKSVRSTKDQTPREVTAASMRLWRTPQSYMYSFSAPRGTYVDVGRGARLQPEEAADTFVQGWRSLLAPENSSIEFKKRSATRRDKHTIVRYAQMCGGLEVHASTLVVHVNEVGGIEMVTNDTMHDAGSLDLSQAPFRPAVGHRAAQTAAIDALAQEYPGRRFTATQGELVIFCPEVFEQKGSPQLAWRVQVSSVDGPPIKELLLINADTRAVALRYTLIPHAFACTVSDAGGSDSRTETSGLHSTNNLVNRAFDYTEDAYRFYQNYHQRDGYDGQGGRMNVQVNSGTTEGGGGNMWVESTAITDDTVGHEYTHSVTSVIIGGAYSGESAAIRESLSDMWGEWIDQAYYHGDSYDAERYGPGPSKAFNDEGFYGTGVPINDAEAWVLFEDDGDSDVTDRSDPDNVKYYRCMSDPTSVSSVGYQSAYDGTHPQPDCYVDKDADYSAGWDKEGSLWLVSKNNREHGCWYIGSGDYGGAHHNLGVGNKLCYLLSSKLGNVKAAQLMYDAIHALPDACRYYDLGEALLRAADNLVYSATEYKDVEDQCREVGILRSGYIPRIYVNGTLNPQLDPDARPGGPTLAQIQNNDNPWDYAVKTLSKGLELAQLKGATEVWVVGGDSQNALDYAGPFSIPRGVAIYSGFAGTERNASERRPAEHLIRLMADSGSVLTASANDLWGNEPDDPIETGVYDFIIENNGKATGITVPSGGAGWVTVSNCTFRNCVTAVEILQKGTFLIDRCSIEGCQMDAVYAEGGSNDSALEFYHCSIKGSVWYGVYSSGFPLGMYNCAIIGNGRPGGSEISGGGVLVGGGPVSIVGCTFSDNRGRRGGLRLAPGASTVEVSACDFAGNESVYYEDGGGADISSQGNVIITACSFVSNHALDKGGGLCCFSSGGTVSRCVFIGNRADGPGGGVYGSGPLIHHCLFSDNRGEYGAAVASSGVSAANCTFLNNIAEGTTSAGGAISTRDAWAMNITNCIFWGNSAQGAKGKVLEIGSSAGVDLSYSALDGDWNSDVVVGLNTGGQGNLSTSQPSMQPLSSSPFIGDYHLSAPGQGHPCVDRGTDPQFAAPILDIDGDTVPLGAAYDIGADEYNPAQQGVWIYSERFLYVVKQAGSGQGNAIYVDDGSVAADIVINFDGATSPDQIALYRRGQTDYWACKTASASPVPFSLSDSTQTLYEGFYEALLVEGFNPDRTPKGIKARCQFFVDGEPPTPNPATIGLVRLYPKGSGTVVLQMKPARGGVPLGPGDSQSLVDLANPVEYQFVAHPKFGGPTSDWLTDPNEGTPLYEFPVEHGTIYAYAVKARFKKAPELETRLPELDDWEQWRIQLTTPRLEVVETTGLSKFVVRMVPPMGVVFDPISSSDPNIQYRFVRLENGVEQRSSGWQNSTYWLDNNDVPHTPNTTYIYQVQFRYGSSNVSEFSDASDPAARVTTLAADVDDTQAPKPDPMTWAVEPYATGGTEISMTATTAVDVSTPIRYFFECVTDSAYSSTWQTSTIYQPAGLESGREYVFQVRAKDDANNIGTPSEPRSVWTDTTPPVASAGDLQVGAGYDAVVLTATIPQDSGSPIIAVEFARVDSGGEVIRSSGWRDESSSTYAREWYEWEDWPLQEGVTYYYRHRLKDQAGNIGGWSTVQSAQVIPDTMPPSPDPMEWADPSASDVGITAATLHAVTASASGAWVEYLFDCNENPSLSSGWQLNNPDYTVTGLSPNTQYTFTVKARKQHKPSLETDPSVPLVFTTNEVTDHVAYNVDTDVWFPTIDQAIREAADGQTIEIEPNTYEERLDLTGKTITLRGTDPDDWETIAATIIDGGGVAPVITFGEDSRSTIVGLTITGGTDANNPGGGVYVDWTAEATISRCYIRDNTASHGAGIYGGSGVVLLNDCAIEDNAANIAGGGVYGQNLSISGCTFTSNTAGGYGGGVSQSGGEIVNCILNGNWAGEGGGLNSSGDITVAGCVFSGNSADGDGGGLRHSNGQLTLTNCTLVNNQTPTGSGGGVYSTSCPSPEVTNCIFWGNRASRNNFLADPNCVALYYFEPEGLTADSSGNGNTLTNVNSVSGSSTAIQGSQSASFATYYKRYLYREDAGLSSNFPLKSGDTNKKMTVCAWIRPAALNWHNLFHKGDSNGKYSLGVMLTYYNDLEVYFGYNGGASSEAHRHGSALTVNEWYHVAVTYQDSDRSYRLSVWDDESQDILGTDLVGNAGHSINVEDGPFFIGSGTGGASPTFTWQGLIDEVVVFRDVLTPDEIAQIRDGSYGMSGQGEICRDQIGGYRPYIHSCAIEGVSVNGYAVMDQVTGTQLGYYQGGQIITTNPGFTDIYHLSSSSPCIDVGVNPGELPVVDIDGNRRVFGAAVDMGADEYFVPDTTAPTPNPMQWDSQGSPEASGGSSIIMTAATASDASTPIVYYFQCNTTGGHSSGWQLSPVYEDTGLEPNTPYGYQVMARDAAGNSTGLSNAVQATTTSGGPIAHNLNTDQWYGSIQDAIGASSDGHIIEIAQGTHTEAIDFDGKDITVRGTNSSSWTVVENTVINSMGTAPVVNVSSGSYGALEGLTITGANNSSAYGGGVYVHPLAQATISKCLIRNNTASYGGGIHGSGSTAISGCRIEDNHATNAGGGVDGSGICLENCILSGNSATVRGGGMDSNGDPNVIGCVFSANSTDGNGGAIYQTDGVLTLTNCTIRNNTASTGTGGGLYSTNCEMPEVTNCIFWGNTASSHDQIGGYLPYIYSCAIQEATRSGSYVVETGVGNIGYNSGGQFVNTDPNFIDDFHLACDSVCIDKGQSADDLPSTDVDGDARTLNFGIEMGADEVSNSIVPGVFGEELDTTTLSFTTGGGAPWFGQTSTYYYDSDAMQSGDIEDSQESWLQTTVTGAGTLTFWWKVSSETNYDFLEFYIGSTLQSGPISGSTNWAQKSYNVTGSGSHTLKWRYVKDDSSSYNSDCGWVDYVVFTPNP